MSKQTAEQETQTYVRVVPHILYKDEEASVYIDACTQTSVTFLPETTVENVLPMLKANLDHTIKLGTADGDTTDDKASAASSVTDFNESLTIGDSELIDEENLEEPKEEKEDGEEEGEGEKKETEEQEEKEEEENLGVDEEGSTLQKDDVLEQPEDEPLKVEDENISNMDSIEPDISDSNMEYQNPKEEIKSEEIEDIGDDDTAEN